MYRSRRLAALAAMVFVSSLAPALAHAAPAAPDRDDRYIVRFKNPSQGRAALARARGRVVLELPGRNAVAARVPAAALKGLMRSPAVELVEPDPKRYLLAQTTPYGIDLVQAPQAWSGASASAVKVCVVDSGLDASHVDLQQTGVTGYPADWNRDGCGHGTHVTGTIAALDNDRGVVGVNPQGISLHVVKVFGDDCGWAYASSLLSAVDQCRRAGAKVVSMSLGGSYASAYEASVYQDWYENEDMLFVAAAGNDGNSRYSYPASYDAVVSVAAVDRYGRRASFSQYNAQVELAAPGVSVASTVPGDRYAYYSGTSMATPHVSGVAALVWSHDPTWTAAQVREALTSTAGDLGAAGRDPYYGFGLVQASAALEHLAGAVAEPPPPPPNVAPQAAFQAVCTDLDCAFTDASSDADGEVTAWRWDFGDGQSSALRNPAHTYAAEGTYQVTLTVTDDAGGTGRTAAQVTVTAPVVEPAPEPAPEPGPAPEVSLTVVERKSRGQLQAELRWSGAAGSAVEVYRDGALLWTTPNDGAAADALNERGKAAHTYRLCELGGAVCSATMQASW